MIDLRLGDCLEVMKTLPDNSVDACVTDPPYGWSFMGRRWDYDVPAVDIWREVYRVLKPGAHILVACGTRTQHRMAVNIEDAGFEIRDVITWLYGSGFPKSMNISKAIDATIRCGGSNTRRLRQTEQETGGAPYTLKGTNNGIMGEERIYERKEWEPTTPLAQLWDGWGTALKPACEFWTLARKPISEGTIAANVLKWGTGGINIDGCRIASEMYKINTWDDGSKPFGGGAGHDYTGRTTSGRFPANLILDEVAATMLDEQSGVSKGSSSPRTNHGSGNNCYGEYGKVVTQNQSWGDTGGASRFFKCCPITKEDLCESVNTAELSLNQQSGQGDFAQNAVVTLEHQEASVTRTERSQVILDYIGSCSRCTPLRSHAQTVANQGNTDTTETIPNRSKSSGCVLPAIEENTRLESIGARENTLSGQCRFRYVPKASRTERDAGLEDIKALPVAGRDSGQDARNVPYKQRISPRHNPHPTVKPIALMRYLCRLITPPDGVVLDPFMGSGSTGCAAGLEGFGFIGIELDTDYHEIARRRIEHWCKQPALPVYA